MSNLIIVNSGLREIIIFIQRDISFHQSVQHEQRQHLIQPIIIQHATAETSFFILQGSVSIIIIELESWFQLIFPPAF